MTHLDHLREEEFVDLVDDVLPPARASHLANCAACRDQADTMRAVLGRAVEVGMPEPSPLFWEHLSARVRDAVAEAPAPSSRLRDWVWHWRPAAAWAAAVGSLAVTLTLMHSAWVPWHPPSPAVSEATVATQVAVSGNPQREDEPADDVEGDRAWAVVSTVAEGVAWDDAHEAGLAARPGAAEGMVLEMTRAEQSALEQVLKDELGRSGT